MEMLSHARNKVIALGGVTYERLPEVVDMGFDGAGMLGAIWSSKNPVKELIRSQEFLKASAAERSASDETFAEKASLSA